MNKEIKIIDLLNMIAEGKEAPKKIKYDNTIYKYDEQYDYQNKLQINYYSIDKGGDFFNNVYCYSLNDEVEIIEENEKGISREELENRIENALEFLETQHGTYPSGKMWREALKNVLQGKNADDVYFEDNNKIEKDLQPYFSCSDEDLYNGLVNKLYKVIDYINEKWGMYE